MRTRTILGGARRPRCWAHTRRVSNPAIILVSGDHLDVLEEQFWRYTREYDVRCARTALPRPSTRRSTCSRAGGQVALFVLESVLPDMEIYPAIAKIRQTVPTARRVVVAHWENFRRDADALRARPGHRASTTRSC